MRSASSPAGRLTSKAKGRWRPIFSVADRPCKPIRLPRSRTSSPSASLTASTRIGVHKRRCVA
jgi:hypothetical protein